MVEAAKEKPLFWIASSKRDLANLPDAVRRRFGFALGLAQRGAKHPDAKPLRGFSGGGVLEVVAESEHNAFRAVYTIKFEKAVYVLHVFQKKSKVESPPQEKK